MSELTTGNELIKSGKYKNTRELLKSLKNRILEASTPDQGRPVVPINCLRKIGNKYNTLNSFIVITEKDPPGSDVKNQPCWLSAPNPLGPFIQCHEKLEKIQVRQILETSYYRVMQATIPEGFFCHTKLIEDGIKLNISFNVPCRDIFRAKNNQLHDKNFDVDNNPLWQHEVKLKLTEVPPKGIKWELIPDDGCDRWVRHVWAFDAVFLESIDADFLKTCMRLKEKDGSSSELFYWLNKFLFFPTMELRALLHITSGLSLLDIEKYFVFGEGDIHDHLLESFNNYWNFTLDELKAINDKVLNFLSKKELEINPNTLVDWWFAKFFKEANECGNNTGDIYLDHGIIDAYDSYSDAQTSYCFSAKELMARNLHFCLEAPIQDRLNFLHEIMTEEYEYDAAEYTAKKDFLSFDCDLETFTRKCFFPASDYTAKEAQEYFETFVNSLIYKKGLLKTQPKLITVIDLDDYEPLKELRFFCQSLLRIYSDETLFFELRKKGCTEDIAIRLLYRHIQKNKKQPELKVGDRDFGYDKGTLRKEAWLLEGKFGERAELGNTNIIAILAPAPKYKSGNHQTPAAF